MPFANNRLKIETQRSFGYIIRTPKQASENLATAKVTCPCGAPQCQIVVKKQFFFFFFVNGHKDIVLVIAKATLRKNAREEGRLEVPSAFTFLGSCGNWATCVFCVIGKRVCLSISYIVVRGARVLRACSRKLTCIEDTRKMYVSAQEIWLPCVAVAGEVRYRFVNI